MREASLEKKLGMVFAERKYVIIAAVAAAVFLLVYSIFAEMVPLPLPNYSPIRMEPITVFDIAFMAIFSGMAGVAVAAYWYSRSGAGGVCTLSGGVFLGFLTGFCPFCPIFIISLLGASVTLEFLAPYFPLLRAISMALLIASLYLLVKRVKARRAS